MTLRWMYCIFFFRSCVCELRGHNARLFIPCPSTQADSHSPRPSSSTYAVHQHFTRITIMYTIRPDRSAKGCPQLAQALCMCSSGLPLGVQYNHSRFKWRLLFHLNHVGDRGVHRYWKNAKDLHCRKAAESLQDHPISDELGAGEGMILMHTMTWPFHMFYWNDVTTNALFATTSGVALWWVPCVKRTDVNFGKFFSYNDIGR